MKSASTASWESKIDIVETTSFGLVLKMSCLALLYHDLKLVSIDSAAMLHVLMYTAEQNRC